MNMLAVAEGRPEDLVPIIRHHVKSPDRACHKKISDITEKRIRQKEIPERIDHKRVMSLTLLLKPWKQEQKGCKSSVDRWCDGTISP